MNTSRTKSALFLSISQNVNLVLSILSTAILARYFTQQDLGIYKQTNMVFDLVTPFLLLSIPEALYFFLPKGESEKTIFNSYILVTFTSIITFLVLFFGRNMFSNIFHNIALKDTLKIYALFALFFFPLQLINPILIFFDKSSSMAVWVCITNFIMIVAIIITAITTQSYIILISVRVIVEAVTVIVSMIWILKILKLDRSLFKVDFPYIFKIFKYSLPLGLTALMGTLCLRMDKFVVSLFVTPEEFAIYNNGAIEIPFINSITGSISAVIIVDYVKYYQNGEFDKIVELFKKCAYKSAIFLFPIMAYFIFWKTEFIVTLYSEKYLQSSLLFFIYLFTIPSRIVQYGVVIQAMNKNFFLVVRSIGDLIINIIFNFIFIHIWGMKGAAIATVCLLYFWTVPFNLIIIGKNLNYKVYKLFPWKKLFIILLVSLSITFVSQFVKLFNISDFFKLAISVFFCVLIYTPLLYFIDYDLFIRIKRIIWK